MTLSVNIGFISRGGPGRTIIILLFSSIIQPGAVPLLFLRTIEPSGI